MRDPLIKECQTIQQNSEYTAEAHHNLAKHYNCLHLWLQLIPGIGTAISTALILAGVVAKEYMWAAALMAAIAAISNILSPEKNYYSHLQAAKSFTCIKHDARALHQSFAGTMTDNEFKCAVLSLHSRYNDLARMAPPTDEKSFAKAKERIDAGVHKND